MKTPKINGQHVDDFISHGPPVGGGDVNTQYARWVLLHFRQPATVQFATQQFMANYTLFVTYQGERYRLIGASRLGDVWLTKTFSRSHGYDVRVLIAECSEFSDTPEYRPMNAPELSVCVYHGGKDLA